MKVIVTKGATDQTVYVFIQDSSSTTGAGLTGLVYNSASLSCYYVRPGAAAAQLSLATQTVNGAHSDGGFVEVSSSNMPGWYRLDLSDAIVATGVNSVGLQLKGATNMAPCNLEIQLVAANLQDAVRLGLTALPNAAADAAGGLPISDAGGLDMDAILSRIGTPTNLGGGSATLAGNLQDIEAQTDDIGAAGAGLTAIPNSAGVTTLLTRVGTPSDLGGGASIAANLADIEAQTDDIGAAGAGLTAITGVLGTPAGASLAADVAAVKSDTAAILDDTGTAGVVVAAASKTGYRLSATGVGDILTTALTESYAADGAAPTLAQAVFGILQFLTEREITTTTMTVKRLDGSTTAMTFTLDDANSPTSITRAS